METIVGIVVIIALSILGANKSFTRIPILGNVNIFFLTGTEFLIVGILLGPYFANALTKEVVRGMHPFIGLGLGWLGLLYGLQFDFRRLIRIPPGYFFGAFNQSIVTFSVLFGSSLLFFRIFGTLSYTTLTISFIFASVGSCSSQTAPGLMAQDKEFRRSHILRMLRFISSIGDLPGLIIFGIIFSFLQSSPLFSGVPLAFLQWTVISILLGAVFGWLTIYLIRLQLKKDERLLFAIGIILFCGGTAAYLQLSPLFVNFIAGVIIANFCRQHHEFDHIMAMGEKPIYLILLVLAGGLLEIEPVAAIAGGILFLLVRIAGKVAGGYIVVSLNLKKSDFPWYSGLGLINQGGMALAMIINFQFLNLDSSLNSVITAVISAIIFSELLGQRMLSFVLSKEPGQ